MRGAARLRPLSVLFRPCRVGIDGVVHGDLFGGGLSLFLLHPFPELPGGHPDEVQPAGEHRAESLEAGLTEAQRVRW